MKRLFSCSMLALMVGAGSVFAQEAGSDPILDRRDLPQIEGQNLDPNRALLEALRAAAIKPPQFRVSSSAVSLETQLGTPISRNLRLVNEGGRAGAIYGITTVGAFEGLMMTHDCPAELMPGAACDIEVSYDGARLGSIQTAIVVTMEEPERTSIEIPVEVQVTAPPREEPRPDPVIVQRPNTPVAVAEPQGPSNEDIARRYFGAMGGMRTGPAAATRGFTVVSASKPDASAEVAGVALDDLRVETIYSQSRYDDGIAATDASLPVDRDRILTTDRVIKAVLETPVSNVMCNKAVALVESDVYSATSAVPLIPAGSRVVGTCQEFVDERVGIAWERIITNDGRSITFENLQADTRDANGLGGAVGRIYQSKFDQYVLPIFSTMIDTVAGVIFATFGEDETIVTEENGRTIQETSAQNEGIRLVTEEARGTAQQIITDIRDVRKIAVIPAGSRIDIEINEDIYFVDSRRVLRLADMTFDLEDVGGGPAVRDLPEGLTLVPVERGYRGPAVTIDGRRYKVEQRAAEASSEPVSRLAPETSATLEDLARPME